MKNKFSLLDRNVGMIYKNFLFYLRENKYIIIFISLVALCAYGFELFNLNLTIDEEMFAPATGPYLAWIWQGRWGMYLLTKFLLPYSVIPFVPLFLALIFHLGAILLIFASLEIKGKFDKIIIGSIGIAYPGIAYIYTFSTINFGIGIGLFCVALSLYIYVKSCGLRRLFAVIPAGFAISIYQGFLPALFAVYLLYIIKVWLLPDTKKVRTLLHVLAICITATLLYYTIQRLITVVGRIPSSGYVEQYFSFDYLINNSRHVISGLATFLFKVYTGNKSVYGQEVQILGVFLVVLSLGICVNTWKSKADFPNKVLILIFSVFFLLLPFVGGLFTGGFLTMRFLVALPITLSGWVLLGINNNSRLYKSVVAILAVICLLQFVVSTNHLFASSSLALEQDRIVGSQLIERIELQEGGNKKEILYLEMIGYLNNPSTVLIPKSETFGASFFEWDQGNVGRVLLFLQTLGYDDLQALPLDQRAQMVETATAMPIWPDRGSVKVIGDVALVKFGPYSDIQKFYICQPSENSSQLQNLGFCLK